MKRCIFHVSVDVNLNKPLKASKHAGTQYMLEFVKFVGVMSFKRDVNSRMFKLLTFISSIRFDTHETNLVKTRNRNDVSLNEEKQ